MRTIPLLYPSVVNLKYATQLLRVPSAYFKFENHTRIIELLVTLLNLKFVRRRLINETNFRFR